MAGTVQETVSARTCAAGGLAAVSSSAGGSTGGSGGAAPSPVECTLPATPPSNGSCVTFVAGDAGEVDAGVDDGGVASITTCNPVTNAGCTGTDWCGPDATNSNFFCQPAGTPAGILACGDCTELAATCGGGGLCVGFTADTYTCINMCCTDADCGAGKCDTTVLTNALPSGVGLCVTP